MLKNGYATIYEDGGARYGGYEKEMRIAEKTAKKFKKGMWKQSESEYQSPSNFKKMIKNQKDDFFTSFKRPQQAYSK
jgi:endonuclease YncB( thermonuclease family)